MNDLEKELRSLQPAAPTKGFEARMEKSLGEAGNVAVKHVPEVDQRMKSPSADDSGKVVPFGRFRFLFFAGAAAALVVAIYLMDPFAGAEVEISPVAPSLSEVDEDLSPLHGVPLSDLATFSEEGWNDPRTREVLVDATDEGIVDRPGQAPARRYRYRFLDETIWENPGTNTRIRSTVPREEVVLVGLDPY
jgi:hypothetical protein